MNETTTATDITEPSQDLDPGQPASLSTKEEATAWRQKYESSIAQLPVHKDNVPKNSQIGILIHPRNVFAPLYLTVAMLVGVGDPGKHYQAFLKKKYESAIALPWSTPEKPDTIEHGTVSSEQSAALLCSTLRNPDGSMKEPYYFLAAMCRVAMARYDHEKVVFTFAPIKGQGRTKPKHQRQLDLTLSQQLHNFLQEHEKTLLEVAAYFNVTSARARTAESNRRMQEIVHQRSEKLAAPDPTPDA